MNELNLIIAITIGLVICLGLILSNPSLYLFGIRNPEPIRVMTSEEENRLYQIYQLNKQHNNELM